MTDKETPSTPRVTVNRYWQTIFGRGLSNTPSDFGSQGSWPTHPDLLNWLAADFIEHDWDVKRMIKKLVTSATYRQSSLITQDHLKKILKISISLGHPASVLWVSLCVTKPFMSVDYSKAIWWTRSETISTRGFVERSIP